MDYGRSVGRGILGTDRVDARSRARVHSESIDAAAGELQQAIGELRDIARGLHPVVLRDAGLAAALRAAANPAT